MSFWIFQNFENHWKSEKSFKNSQNQSKTRKSLKCTKNIQLYEYNPNTLKYTKLWNFDCFSSFLIIHEVWNNFRVFAWISRIWTIFENLIGGVFEWFSTFWMNFDFLIDCRVHEWFSSFSMIFDLLNDTREFEWFWCFSSN